MALNMCISNKLTPQRYNAAVAIFWDSGALKKHDTRFILVWLDDARMKQLVLMKILSLILKIILPRNKAKKLYLFWFRQKGRLRLPNKSDI